MVFWHPNGWTVYRVLEDYIRDRLEHSGYQEIRTPQLVDQRLWEASGHWDKYQENMFVTSSESRDYAVKPMNCPCHVQIYNKKITSYRELPIRLAEFGSCHRNEPSGSLHGLMRVRNFVQDDAHIFCTEDQITDEVKTFNKLLMEVYRDMGFDDIIVRISTRPKKRVGDDESWDKAEKALSDALDELGVEWEELPGEGAFYGPKIEYSLKDCLGRVWQCGTLQVDFSMPGRLGAEYVAEDGSKQTPVMLHRAILGSLERFIGILLENTMGWLPPWLSPTQAVVLTITDSQHEYAKNVEKILGAHGLRVKSDLRNEKIGYKIRHHTLQRVPYLLVVGDKEVENQQVAVRTRSFRYRIGGRVIRRAQPKGAPGEKRTLINEEIRASKVRLIGPTGEQIGVVNTEDALAAARENDLDLVLIAESSDPPVAKIMDFGKRLYEEKKAKAAAKKKQHQLQVKEIKFRPGTDVGDYQVKLRNLVRFLEDGDKAKVTIRFRGREMAHQELGMQMLERLERDLEEYGVVEARPKLEGRQMIMVFAPKKK